MPPPSRWPKSFPPLSEEQKRVSDDFMRYWHEVLPQRYGFVDDFNHEYVVRNAPKVFNRTLEIGAGIGEHLEYERLTKAQLESYVALDIRANMIEKLRRRWPMVQAVVGDCQERLDFPDGHFDRIVAVHVLEHLPDLPRAIAEIHRVCDKSRGVLSVVVPCEGSFAYSCARKLSAQRIFEARYQQPYKWFIEREHINVPFEIFAELSRCFVVTHTKYFPLPLKLEFCNLCIGATLRPRATSSS